MSGGVLAVAATRAAAAATAAWCNCRAATSRSFCGSDELKVGRKDEPRRAAAAAIIDFKSATNKEILLNQILHFQAEFCKLKNHYLDWLHFRTGKIFYF